MFWFAPVVVLVFVETVSAQVRERGAVVSITVIMRRNVIFFSVSSSRCYKLFDGEAHILKAKCNSCVRMNNVLNCKRNTGVLK